MLLLLLLQGDLAHSWARRGGMAANVLQHSSSGSVGEKCITLQPCPWLFLGRCWLGPWGQG